MLLDMRYAFRMLLRDRTFTAIAIFSLALGIGANAAIFSLMDTLLWRELPVRDSDRLVSFANSSRSYFGYSEFAKYSRNALESVIAASGVLDSQVDLGSGPREAQIEFVTGSF